jgi:long-chain acyl-CoA synthetase
VGRPAADWGAPVDAYFGAGGAAPAPAHLDRLCLAHIARFKRPREYRFVERLPKNNYGKVVKGELRAMIAASGGEAVR